MELYIEASPEEIDRMIESSKDRLLRAMNGRESEFLRLYKNKEFEAASAIAGSVLPPGYGHVIDAFDFSCKARLMLENNERVYRKIDRNDSW